MNDDDDQARSPTSRMERGTGDLAAPTPTAPTSSRIVLDAKIDPALAIRDVVDARDRWHRKHTALSAALSDLVQQWVVRASFAGSPEYREALLHCAQDITAALDVDG